MSTPAHRVSRALKKGGITTTHPESPRLGVKVTNMETGFSLPVGRRGGLPVVRVHAEFDVEAFANRRAALIAEVLTRAGFRAEVLEGAATVHVWEPEWQTYLDTPAPTPDAPAVVEWRADKLSDGAVIVHASTCTEQPPGKSMPVQGRTAEAIVREVYGKLIRKTQFGDPARMTKFVRFHEECIPPAAAGGVGRQQRPEV